MTLQENIESCMDFTKNHEVIAVNNYMLANTILGFKEMKTLVGTKEILCYAGGHYVPNGEELIHKVLVTWLAPYRKQNGQTVYNNTLLKEVLGIKRNDICREYCL